MPWEVSFMVWILTMGCEAAGGRGHSPEPPSVHPSLASLHLFGVAPGVERCRFFEDGADGTAIEAEQ